jgi:CheY-like chemotaxis protein
MRNETAPSVLVVEDEGLVALLLREVMTDLGLKPHVFTEGKPALATIGAASYSAAVLDLGLPDIDGHEIVKALLERNPQFPIVVTTGQDQQEVEDRFPKTARVRVLCKPFDIGMLEDELEKLDIVAKPFRPPPRFIEEHHADEHFAGVAMIA